MDFVKMEALGNDFVVVDGPNVLRASDVQRWCDRRFGVGADGVLVVTPVDPTTITMEYWNADGSVAEMCGNGLRCVAKLAYNRGWVGAAASVNTAVGPLAAQVLDDGNVRAAVGRPEKGRVESLEVAGVRVRPIRVGNPHAVLFVDDTDDAPVKDLGQRIERDAMFPDGTNVGFVAVESANRIRMRVWERGVGETMASGTAATAAAYAAALDHGTQTPIEVLLPGGALTIELTEDLAWMTGPANTVFRGSVE